MFENAGHGTYSQRVYPDFLENRMSKTNARLGKGLNALIGPRRAKAPAALIGADAPVEAASVGAVGAVGAVKSLPIDAVIPNRHQPRSQFDDARIAELAASIKTSGVIQPIVVRPGPDGQYELIAGERRWRAARLAEQATVPAIVRKASDTEALELALVENLQREDLNAIERAVAYQRYTEAFGASPEQLATRLGESRANVVNYMRLLSLAADVRTLIENGDLGMGQARALAGVADRQRQLAIAKLAVRRNLSVRQVEGLVKQGGPSEGTRTESASRVDANLAQVQRSLSKSIGLPVTLHAGKRKNSGRIVIRYASLEEFDRIAERLSGDATLE
jgi:ParB family chromosome partitioning protein